MQITRQYTINTPREKLTQRLKTMGLDVWVNEGNGFFVLRILEDDSRLCEVERLLDAEGLFSSPDMFITYTKKYSAQECNEAKYLHVQSVYAGVQFPDIDYQEVFRSSHFAETVMIGARQIDVHEHSVQIAPIQLVKAPKWRTARQFCSGYFNGMVDLFCSDMAKGIIEEAGLAGSEFRPVLSRKSQKPVPNVWQLWPHECEDFLAPGPHMDIRTCATCGMRRYVHRDGRAEIQIHDDTIPHGLDFMQSPPLVGKEIGYPYYVISSRAYRVLEQAKITQDLVFTPLKTV